MASLALERVCKQLPKDLLMKRVPISLLDETAYDLVSWEELAPYIGLTNAEQQQIKCDYDGQYLLQKRTALRTWRKNCLAVDNSSATLESFLHILCKEGQISLAEIVAKKSQNVPTRVLIFAKYLRSFYIDDDDFAHPANNQWPTILGQTDLPPTYIDLKFQEVPFNASSKPREVQPATVFKKTKKRFVILFEGIAGSGKTTFSWYACREWANNRLLQQFDLLIHVKLNNPRFQSACKLQDLIPDPEEASDETAQAIADMKGSGTCFLLEGLDEASEGLQHFILKKLLCDRRLPHLCVIITSRPDSRLSIALGRSLSARIVINGFSIEKLNEFLTSALGNGTSERRKVDRILELSPQFQALCTLPINAVVFSHLVQCFGKELPSTQTGLFNLLTCHICVRHYQLHNGSDLSIEQLPYDLPSELRESFDKLCLLAYTTSMEKKKSLSAKDLEIAKFDETVDNKVGILQIHQIHSMYGVEKNCYFPHFALQQFFAALHLSCQSKNVQCSVIEQIMERDPLDEIIPFYGGLTHLACEESRRKLFRVLDKYLDSRTITEQLMKKATTTNDPRRRVLSLLRCLYECQTESMMNEARLQIKETPGNPDFNFNSIISFKSMWLSPLECLAVGHFVRYKSISMCKKLSLSVDLDNCSLSETSMSVLAKELGRDIHSNTSGTILLSLADNKFNYKQLMSVKYLLKGRLNIGLLALTKCFEEVDTNIVLKHIVEGLHSKSSCRSILMGYNGLNQSHIYHVALLILACTQLHTIDLSISSFYNVMPSLGKAISLSKLLCVNLNDCNIDDKQLACLAKEISQSRFLLELGLYCNPEITLKGLSDFLLCYVENDVAVLELLGVTEMPLDKHYGVFCRLLQQVNVYRILSKHEQLKVIRLSDRAVNEDIETYQFLHHLPEEFSRKQH